MVAAGLSQVPASLALTAPVGPTWHLDRINQPRLPLDGNSAFGPLTGAGIDIYIVDTGIRSTHEQFGGRVLPAIDVPTENGTSKVSPETNDCDGHGTHVAGLAAGSTVGVATQARLIAVRVLDCNGDGEVADVVNALKWVRAHHRAGVAAVVMTYWNPIERYGVHEFAQSIADNGGSGVITPDLTIEESDRWLAATSKTGINPIYVVAPSTNDARLSDVTAKTGGFVYAASLMGVTGTRTSVSTDASNLVSRVRTVTDLPISVGLGVSTREQAKSLAAYADGVIVGSAFINALSGADSLDSGIKAVRTLVEQLALGVREGRG